MKKIFTEIKRIDLKKNKILNFDFKIIKISKLSDSKEEVYGIILTDCGGVPVPMYIQHEIENIPCYIIKIQNTKNNEKYSASFCTKKLKVNVNDIIRINKIGISEYNNVDFDIKIFTKI